MNNYSYSEIQNMQKRAMDRVREMQRNSDAIVESDQESFNVSRKVNSAEEKTEASVIKPKITNMPPNFPSFNEYFNTASQNHSASEKHSVEKENNLLEQIISEPDRLLILGLLLLLKSEGSDEALIMALTYILS